MKKTLLVMLLALTAARADQTIFQPTIFSTGSSLTIQSGITATFASGSSVNFTGATVTGLNYEPALGNPSTNGYVLSSTTAGVRSWVAQTGGGGGTPGGANSSIQYNASGTFGGDATHTWDTTNLIDAVNGSVNSNAGFYATNTSTGVGAQAVFISKNGASQANYGITGTNLTPSGGILANMAYLYTDAGGGLALFANNASTGAIRFFGGGYNTESGRFNVDGSFNVGGTASFGGGFINAQSGFKLGGNEFPTSTNGLVKRTAANTYSAAAAGTDYEAALGNPSVNAQVLSSTTGGIRSWVTQTSGGAPTSATYVTQTSDGTLTNEFALATLATGLLKSTTSTGALSIVNDNSTNWDTAYTDRLKWDGGATGLTAATGRTSLGGTTVGQNLFTLTNPSAISFLKINADNSVTAESAATFKTDLSLDQVTNNAQTQAAIVPNTAPSSGQILVGNAGGTAYAKQTLSAVNATMAMSSTGSITLTGVSNTALTNSTMSIAGTSTALGGTVTLDQILANGGTALSTGLIKRTATNTLAIATAGTDYLTGNQSISLTGDVTGSGTTSIATTIANSAVTYAKMQNTSTSGVLLGRTSASAGAPQEMTPAGGVYVNGQNLIGKTLHNASTATQSPTAGTDTYLTGSLITIPVAGDWVVGETYHIVISVSKTAAGTTSATYSLRMGTAGTTADTAFFTSSFGAQTAVVDAGTVELWATLGAVGGSGSVFYYNVLSHNTANGLWPYAAGPTFGAPATSAIVATNTATKIGVSWNSGTGNTHTVAVLTADLIRP